MRHEIAPFVTNRPVGREVTGTPFNLLQRQMNRLFDDAWRDFGDLPWMTDDAVLAAPKIDVSEDQANVYVAAEMPGLSEQDLEVDFYDGRLKIVGEKTRESDDEGRNYILSERGYGRFERLVPIAREIDSDRVEASFKDGVLTVTLPKTEQDQARRKIEVKRAA